MGRKLDSRQQRELTDFVNALAEIAGYTTTAEWARDSGYPPPNLSKLRNGRMAVDGYNLLALIRAAAARTSLTPEETVLRLARATADPSGDLDLDLRLRELEATVERQGTAATDAIESLELGIGQIIERLPAPGDAANQGP